MPPRDRTGRFSDPVENRRRVDALSTPPPPLKPSQASNSFAALQNARRRRSWARLRAVTADQTERLAAAAGFTRNRSAVNGEPTDDAAAVSWWQSLAANIAGVVRQEQMIALAELEPVPACPRCGQLPDPQAVTEGHKAELAHLLEVVARYGFVRSR